MSVPAVRIRELDKAFFGVPVLKRVSFEVRPGSIVGLVGENGAGKSTLMNVLGGVVPRDDGVVEVFGREYDPRSPADAAAVGIAFIHQELNLFGNLSVAENLAISAMPHHRIPLLDIARMRAEAVSHLAAVGLAVAPTALVENLSAGERQLVEIAKAVASDARIIIFDEPTTSLTARESGRLFELMRRLRDDGRSLIFISHSLGDVLAQCDDVVVLRDGVAVASGPAEGFSVASLVEFMVGRSIEHLFPAVPPNPHAGSAVLKVDALTRRGVVKDVSFEVGKGEIVGLFGLMGSGRTEMVRMIFGADGYDSGTITDPSGAVPRRRSPRRSISAGIGFVTEDRRDQGVFMSLPVADNIAITTLRRFVRPTGTINRRRLIEACRSIAASLRVKSADITVDEVKNLSGGNQQKVVLARWLLSEPRLLILDEPTRGVDVGAKHDLYVTINELATRGAGVLMVSSELEELLGTCHRILIVHKGEISGEYHQDGFDRESMLTAAFGQTTERASA